MWSEIDNNISDNYDLFICSASYEDRCQSFIKYCPAGKLLYAMVCHTAEYSSEVSNNLKCIENLLREKNIQYESITLYHKDSIESADHIMMYLDKIIPQQKVKNVIIDVTTFTHEMTLILLWLFKEKYNNIDVTFAYSNAENYNPSVTNSEDEEDVEKKILDKWLSKGIDDIRSVLGYPGTLLPAKSTHLVIVVGYEYDRALSIIAEVEPSSLSLLFGKSDSFTTTDKHRGAREQFEYVAKDSLSFLPEDKIFTYDISCNNPKKAKHNLRDHFENIKDSISDKNIVVFTMNNKISTLGVGLLALERKDIQLCYAPALIYNYANYSSPGNNCYLFKNIFAEKDS
jgi:hypothetical protein